MIIRDDLKRVASALRSATRTRISFEPNGGNLDGMSLIIDTEVICYEWISASAQH